MPPVSSELERGKPADAEETQRKRREAAAKKEELPSEQVLHAVPDERRVCPKCGARDLEKVGAGKQTVEFEYVPAKLIRRIHLQETLACKRCEGMVVADGPIRAVEGGHYGPGLIAHLITSKCADSIPLYRLAKQFKREGLPVTRTTMGDLLHAGARELEPLNLRMRELVAAANVVGADETPMPVLAPKQTKKGYLWTFRTENLVSLVFSPSRSGETARKVLGQSQGYLVVDGFTGYNSVTVPDRRIRVACWAHVRRRFFEAQKTTPEAREMLELILDLYRVEKHAKESGILGTQQHLELRRSASAAAVERIADWLKQQKPRHPPKGPLGQAIQYTFGQWQALQRFLEDPRVPLDNNWSERALRPAALGRKNYLFFGGNGPGENIARLYSLVQSCEVNGVDPQAYLADVLVRVKHHPQARIDELLPHRWRAPNTS
jgi:transposase